MKKLWLISLLCLSACTVGPKYIPPENDIGTWSTSFANEAEISLVRRAWWQHLNDPMLDQYLEQAALYNYDLKAAEANILEARGTKRIVAATYYPQIDADALAARFSPSKNGQLIQVPLPNGDIAEGLKTQSLFTAFFDCLWEVDLFGKTKRGVEAALARIESAIEKRNDLLITIQAEVAKNYIEVRASQEKIRLIQESIVLLEQKSALIQSRMQKGLDDIIQYEQILADLTTYKSSLPENFAEFYSAIYSLSVLLGNPPEALLAELADIKPLPIVPDHLLLSARSELLQNRPDIRRAERELAAATADVGVAIANLFPSFTFAGLLGLDSTTIHNLFSWHSKAWALGGNFGAPIFHGGALRGNIQKKRADLEKASNEYQQTVLNALKEAETTLSTFLESLKAQNLLTDSTDHQEIATSLVEKRYEHGLNSELQLIDAKRALLTSQLSLTQSHMASLTNFIALYKALGGAWDARQTLD